MKVICFGDSNTFGHDPRSYFGGRYEEPWPKVLEALSGWTVVNQGQNGRQIPKEAIAFPEDTDLLVIMLGTNDVLQGNFPETVGQRMEHFLAALSVESQNILLIAPPVMKLGSWVPEQGLIDRSEALAEEYEKLSQRLGVAFADSGKWDIPLIFDGVHFDEEGHRTFAQMVYAYILEAFK